MYFKPVLMVPILCGSACVIWQIDSWLKVGNGDVLHYPALCPFLSLFHSFPFFSCQLIFPLSSFTLQFFIWIATYLEWWLKISNSINFFFKPQQPLACEPQCTIIDDIIMYRIPKWIITHYLPFFLFLSLDVGKVRQFILMLKLSGTYKAMSRFPIHSALGAMIGFKLGYIFEQAIPTNLKAILFAWVFIELTSRHTETKHCSPNG